MKRNRLVLLFSCVLAPACSSGDQDPIETADTGEEIPADSTTYYEVTGVGAWMGISFELHQAGRRIVQPANAQILETHRDLMENKTHETVIDVDLEAKTFTAVIDEGTKGEYIGSGSFVGEGWDWTAWESTSVASEDGSYLTSSDTMDENGVITAIKFCFNAEDQQQCSMEEISTPITEEAWLALQE